MAHAATLENPHIRADVVEVEEFPALARMYNVRGVPKTVVNQVVQFVGAVPEDTFIAKVLQAAGKEELMQQTGAAAPQGDGESSTLG